MHLGLRFSEALQGIIIVPWGSSDDASCTKHMCYGFKRFVAQKHKAVKKPIWFNFLWVSGLK